MKDWKTEVLDEGTMQARLRGEIAGTLSELAARYGVDRVTLGWEVLAILRSQIDRDEGLAAYIRFSDRAAVIMRDEVSAITDVLAEDCRRAAR